MNDAISKQNDSAATQPMPTWATYAEAMNRFSRSARAFMEHVHLLTEARDAYQQAMTASAALRNTLDAGDETLRSLILQLEQVVSTHLGEPSLEHKSNDAAKSESSRAIKEITAA